MIEAPDELQKTITIPQDHIDVCKAGNMPYKGNAAGNTEDVTDLTGENTSPAPLPAGFTKKGIIALVFSCAAAVLGLIVISWYGAGELGEKERALAEREINSVEKDK
ncbi:MAG: hypothetical protein M1834_007379 [Cirrosporium novae-zelandiae]|nr:MAG: hypothetical protein M1834_007379 [Cirrosporium novae-zelandiae]